MSTPLFRAPLVVLDTETTSFPHHDWSRVVELAGIHLDVDGTELDSWCQLVRPDIFDDRADGAVKIHGITREMVANADTAFGISRSFAGWLDRGGAPVCDELQRGL